MRFETCKALLAFAGCQIQPFFQSSLLLRKSSFVAWAFLQDGSVISVPQRQLAVANVIVDFLATQTVFEPCSEACELYVRAGQFTRLLSA